MGIVLDEKTAKYFGALAYAMSSAITRRQPNCDLFVIDFARAFKSPGRNTVNGVMVDIASTAESIAIEAKKAGCL